MLPDQYRWIEAEFEPDGDLGLLLAIARKLVAEGNREGAATALNRAYGIAPEAEEVRRLRQAVLDRLAVVEHGLRFRYVPAGTFLMGRDDGEPDEGPRHPVWLGPYWMSETPVSWAAYCRLMGWEPPPNGLPAAGAAQGLSQDVGIIVHHANKIRLQYCEDRTTRAVDWPSHFPGQLWQSGGGQTQTAQELFGSPPRDDPEAPWGYDTKPMVAVTWQEAQELAGRLSAGAVRYALPTEAQWEKAARGGRIGARHAWGDEPPTPQRCDFGRFHEFSIRPATTFPPNGYGLYAVNGCVWEWTSDWYDRDYYRSAPDADPVGPADGEEKVLRGGSWADCAEAVTVTFRMSRAGHSWRGELWHGLPLTPNVGFRLCRTVAGKPG
jgi:formylglycine-generating enzyme required for sulfatase activity